MAGRDAQKNAVGAVMDAFARRPVEQERVLYEEAGRQLGFSAGSVEKDIALQGLELVPMAAFEQRPGSFPSGTRAALPVRDCLPEVSPRELATRARLQVTLEC